jgi:gliding motility-associated protein GldL
MNTWFSRIDRFNFLYSIGAVIILVGVIAKFLEWEYEDELLIIGLLMEIAVFAGSSIQFKKKPFYYKWERVFPDLLDTVAENPQDTVAVHDRIEQVTTGYIGTLQTHIVRLDKLNYDFYKLSDQIRDSMSAIAVNAQSVSESLSKINIGTGSIEKGISEFEALGKSYAALDVQIEKLRSVTELNSGRLAQLEKELAVTGKAIQELGSLSGGILQFIKKDSG